MTFDKDGKRFALTNVLNGPVEIWDLERRALVSRVPEGPIEVMALTDDGKHLLVLTRQSLVRLWAIDDAAEVDRLTAAGMRDAMLSGPFVITLGSSGPRRWLIDPSALLAAGCARLAAGSGTTDDAVCRDYRK